MMADAQGAPGGGAVPMAGATDLLVHWPQRAAEQERTYIDLSGLDGLRRIDWSAGELRLGAMATYWQTLHDERVMSEFPLLSAAARQVGAVQIQSRGTWAGNVANGSPAADGVPVLMACDASIRLVSAAGERAVALDAFYTGYRTSVRRADELIAGITIPRVARDLHVFEKVGPRRAQAITKVGLTVARLAGAAKPWRIVAGSVAPTVRRCPAIEALLERGGPVRSPGDFLPAVNADVSPIDDIRSTADYRRTVLCRLLYHSLKGKCDSVN